MQLDKTDSTAPDILCARHKPQRLEPSQRLYKHTWFRSADSGKSESPSQPWLCFVSKHFPKQCRHAVTLHFRQQMPPTPGFAPDGFVIKATWSYCRLTLNPGLIWKGFKQKRSSNQFLTVFDGLQILLLALFWLILLLQVRLDGFVLCVEVTQVLGVERQRGHV